MKFLIFVFLSAFVLIPLSSSMAVQIDDTLVLYLSFDEEPEDGEVSDLSEYENKGEIKGDPKWEDGKFGKALWLDGVDDYVQVSDSESLRVDEAVTVMVWIRAERYGYPGNNFQGIVAKSNSPRSYSFYTHVNNQGLHFSTWNPSGVPAAHCGSTSTAKVPLDEWVHIAVVGEAGKDGGSHRYYINGEPGGEKSIVEMTALPGDTDLKPTHWKDGARTVPPGCH